uniref:HP domain-containing protein n=1 Tax=Triticum urartu TaxID=4572 RepID=A0A8R7R941_TRIUA
MSISMKNLDPAFRGAGQKDGLEIWRIENFKPVPVPTSSHGKFYMGDSYIILKTTALKNGSFRHDIHYWLGKDTSQDEAGTAAILTVELDAALGGRAVQYRESQGNETEKLLSYFRPCIMPQPGGVASGFNHVEVNEQEHVTRLYVWMGRTTSLQQRKGASEAAEKLLTGDSRTKSHVMKMIEGYETVTFKSKFNEWPPTPDLKLSSEDGRGKVAALLKSQGLDVKGLMKSAPVTEEPESYIDCTGHLQVWRVNGNAKTLLASSEQSKFYTGDCYIFQYTYTGEDKEECLIGTWFGNKSVEEERVAAISLASKMVQAAKFQATMARLYEGKEPIQFFVIFQSLQVFKGGLSSGYKKFIAENGLDDDSYSEAGLALFRIQGSGPENMQAIQADAVSSSLNSSYCYILHDGNSVFTWIGNLTTSLDQELIERQLDAIKSDLPSRSQKEGRETDKFWELLGGKVKYSNKKIETEQESDPRLFSCILPKDGNLRVKEVYHFTQDDLIAEDVFVLDCHSYIFVWFGQEVDAKVKTQAMDIGEKFLVRDFLRENLSRETTIFTVSEGSEPQFFTRFFTWDSAKSLMHGSSYQRKLAILKGGATKLLDKPKRRTPAVSGRGAAQDKAQRSRSMSTSPECHRVRGRSPAFAALTSAFEKPSTRNLSTPPPAVKKLFPKSTGPDTSKEAAISELTSSLEGPLKRTIPKSVKASQEAGKAIQEEDGAGDDEPEDDEGRTVFPYERLVTTSEDPAPDIDITQREIYLSTAEFREKLGMKRTAFYKLPKWKQNKLKSAVQLF